MTCPTPCRVPQITGSKVPEEDTQICETSTYKAAVVFGPYPAAKASCGKDRSVCPAGQLPWRCPGNIG
jgi:hypothetical protein